MRRNMQLQSQSSKPIYHILFFIASLAAVVINLPFQSALAKIYIQMQLKVKFNEMKQSNLSACLCLQVY